jgi:hypothetical protein
MCGIGALPPTCLDQALPLTPLQQLLQEPFLGTPRQEPIPELTEDRKIEARIGQLQPQQIFPINTCTDGLGGLTVGEMLTKLHNGHQRQTPWGLTRLAAAREQVGKVVVGKDGPEAIS